MIKSSSNRNLSLETNNSNSNSMINKIEVSSLKNIFKPSTTPRGAKPQINSGFNADENQEVGIDEQSEYELLSKDAIE